MVVYVWGRRAGDEGLSVIRYPLSVYNRIGYQLSAIRHPILRIGQRIRVQTALAMAGLP
jgi:hypothetical protein